MATAATTATACRNFIGGKWVESKSTQFLERRNPANADEIVARAPLSTREEMREAIIRVKHFDEALAAANPCRYGLASSIYTNDASRIFEFIDRIETGIAHVNSPTVGGEAHVPFGGIKDTGVGPREVGHAALDFYTELKTVYIDYTACKRESSVS